VLREDDGGDDDDCINEYCWIHFVMIRNLNFIIIIFLLYYIYPSRQRNVRSV
jgi:hypothetical protein